MSLGEDQNSLLVAVNVRCAHDQSAMSFPTMATEHDIISGFAREIAGINKQNFSFI